MEMKILWKAYFRRHKGSLAGVFALLFIVSVSLVTVLTVWDSSAQYVREEMERLGFGDLTAWVSQVPGITQLTDEIDSLDTVEITGVQKLIYSEYEANGQESDSEGQLVVYEPENYAYRIFLDDLSGYQAGEAVIHSGELYAPISLLSLLPLMLLLLGFIFLKVRKIGEITPVEIIRGTMGKASKKKRVRFPVRSMGLSFFLALRQLAAGKRRYLNVGVSALLLVFFASFMGYVDSWLGADGKGLMDAFNPADLHIAAQPMGEATSEDCLLETSPGRKDCIRW